MSNGGPPCTDPITGEASRPEERERGFAARRLAFVGAFLALLIVVAVAANYGPVRHYAEARSRVDQATAEVAVLEQQKAELQAQLGKLSQPGHLEDVARQQFSFALPDEEVYVVTGLKDDVEAGDPEGLASGAHADAGAIGADTGSAPGAVAGDTSGEAAVSQPGFLERILLALADLF